MLPWTAQDLNAPQGVNAHDPLTLGVEVQDAGSSTAVVKLTNFVDDVTSVMPNFKFNRVHTVKIDLSGKPKPNHTKTVVGGIIHVELRSRNDTTTTDQSYPALISAGPTVLKFTSTNLQTPPPKRVFVANRSASGQAVDVEVTVLPTSQFLTVSPDKFNLGPKEGKGVTVTYSPQSIGSTHTATIRFSSHDSIASVVAIGIDK